MNIPPEKQLIDEVALEKQIDAAFIEKDWYVTQVIKLISNYKPDGFRFIFSGGTSLSKAHGLLKRFSEDIDFRVIVEGLDTMNQSQQRKMLSRFKADVFGLLKENFDIPNENLSARNGNKFFAIELDYPTAYNIPTALRPHILIEFTVTDLHLPAVVKSVSSFVNEVSGIAPEVQSIECIDPAENAADKVSALVWRVSNRVRGEEDDDPTIVRHLHDLSILKDAAMGNPGFKELAIMTINNDNERCQLISGFTIPEKFAHVINILETDSEYPHEYKQFVEGMSYAADDAMPTFKVALTNVQTVFQYMCSE